MRSIGLWILICLLLNVLLAEVEAFNFGNGEDKWKRMALSQRFGKRDHSQTRQTRNPARNPWSQAFGKRALKLSQGFGKRRMPFSQAYGKRMRLALSQAFGK